MATLSRRSAMRSAGAVLAAACIPAAALARDRIITPPAGPMRFTRKLIRELAENALIEVTREFEVRFWPLGEGFRLDGRQSEVAISAPPGLEGLVALEKRRDESGLFPILLGSDGVILGSNPVPDEPTIDIAVSLAAAKLAEANGDDGGDDFLKTLQNSAAQAMSYLPRDLFAPSAPDSLQTRSLSLPDGSTGQIKIAFRARTSDTSGLMMNASRTVETSVQDEVRTSIERWSLTQL